MNRYLLKTILVLLLGSINTKISFAQCSSSDVEIDVIAAYNLIDDSNVQTPAGVRVTGAHFGARFYNRSNDTLVNVFAYIGTYTGSGGTPGIYPSKTHPGLTGTFSFKHSANLSDATRFIDTLLPGEYKTMYWLIEYPNVDLNGKPVYGQCSDETDDLKLRYDIWSSFAQDNNPNTLCYTSVTRFATIRCEITAAANKIWPQGDNKVPNEWVNILNQVGYELGWDLPSNALPGDIGLVAGTWYDLGNVNQGFDNDGDFVPDYNAWMQPVGNPELFDANCFRLVRTFGLLLIKTNDQGVIVRPFEDQLYFKNLPPSNTGVVGYVRYEFMVLNGPCAGQLTPYQEVASGRNNEKFNADFGSAGNFTTAAPQASIEKSVDSVRISFPPNPHSLKYTVKVSNSGSVPFGSPIAGVPAVITDAIPPGTTYKSGSASSSSGSYSFKILYSTDGGTTWVSNEPSPVSTITDIQWWFKEPLLAGQNASVTYEINVPASYIATNGPVVLNTAYLSIGNSAPFDQDDALTFLNGTNSAGDTVFNDNGAGGGIAGDGIKNGSEGPIANVLLSLYYDRDSNGLITDADIFFDSVRSDNSGKYLFTKIPDGNWLIQVKRSDVTENNQYKGYSLSTQGTYGFRLDGNESYLDADFGFTPALVVTKNYIGSNPVPESGQAVFEITVKNNLYNPDFVDPVNTFWMTTVDAAVDWTTSNNAVGASGPDGQYATDAWSNGKSTIDPLWTSGGVLRKPGNITKVELLSQMYYTGTMTNDSLVFSALVGTQTIRNAYSGSALSTFQGSSNAGLLVNDVTNKRPSWSWDDILNIQRRVTATRAGNFDDMHVFVDALGVRVTTDAEYVPARSNFTLTPIPLVDSFNVNQFEFVSADPAPNTVDNVNGKLFWTTIGDLNPGESTTIQVILKPKEPINNNDAFRNTTWSKDAKFFNGDDANYGEDFASVNVEQRGTLSGKIWSDACGGSNGSYNSSVDGLLSNVRVRLLVCASNSTNQILWPAPDPTKVCTSTSGNPKNDGYWKAIDTVRTNNQGVYLFEGLNPGYYVAEVLTADIASPSQTFDPDGTSDNRWGNLNANLNTFNAITANENEINKDFGYTIPPIISGYAYEVIGSISVPAIGVTITTSPASVSSVTDANGYYALRGVTANTNYTLNYSTPSGATWSLSSGPGNQNLCTGKIAVNQNFNFTRTGTSNIGDTLFFDLNGNGVRNTNEEGIPGITIYIVRDIDGNGVYNASIDIVVDSQVTNSQGYYLSAGLPSGSYIAIVNTNDPDWPQGTKWTYDPDEIGICEVCNGRGTVTLNGTADVLTVDFGVYLEGDGVIAEVVWVDRNNDLIKSPLEPGIDSVLVTLYADMNNDGVFIPIQTKYTANGGFYEFNQLPDGIYRVGISLNDPKIPDEYVNTNYSLYSVQIVDGQTNNSTISCSNCPRSANFAFNTYASIGDFVYWDANGNGSQDWTESGIANVKVYLLDSNGSKIDSVLTADGTGLNPKGYYRFSELLPARYSVVVDHTDSDLKGATQTADPNSGGLSCQDPQLSVLGFPSCDHRFTSVLSYGENDISADFGYDPPGSFGDYVWRDTDGDGVIDPGEQPLGNVALYLCGSSSPCTSSSVDFIDSVLTDPDGYYYFSDLSNQTYSLTIVPPAGYTLTRYSAASTISVVMSNDTISAIAGQACGGCGMDVDFGLKLSGNNSIAGTICVDDGANDGVCDGTVGEDYLGNVAVFLYQKVGSSYELFSTTTTDQNGNYAFADLPNDTFTVSIGRENQYIKISTLTTTDADAPAGDITETGNSIFQPNIILSGGTSVNNVDFAFDLQDLDLGDLPAKYGVLLNNSGPYHLVNTSWKLGSNIDAEVNGLVSKWADGDDNSNLDDDDGVTFVNAGSWKEGQTACVNVSYSIPMGEKAYLGGWIDWQGDGNFIGDNVVSTELNSGSSSVQVCFNIPNSVNMEKPVHFARFRLFSDAQELMEFGYSGAPQGARRFGEVEDYAIKLMQNSQLTDFGDLPITYGTAWNVYTDTNENNIPDQVGAVWLGEFISNELDQRYNAAAAGENTGDDGLLFPAQIDTSGIGANTFKVIVNATQPGNVYYRFWIDWDMDGAFDSTYAGFGVAASPDTSDVTVYAPDYYQGSFAVRLRADDSPITAGADTGQLINGETEDYIGNIQPLPVDLIKFEAHKISSSTVQLDWVTASERNNDRFEIERLVEGQFEFKRIATVKGAGNSNNIQTYAYLDNLGEKAKGTVYYRLRQIDFDGKYEFSPIRAVQFDENDLQRVTLFPNPTSGTFTILFADWYGPRHISLTDVQGRELDNRSLPDNVLELDWDLKELPVGLYFITIRGEREIRTIPLIRQFD